MHLFKTLITIPALLFACSGPPEPRQPTPSTAVDTPRQPVNVPVVRLPPETVRSLRVSFAGTVPQPVTSLGAAATSTHLYTLGGYFGKPHQYVREHQSHGFARMNLSTGNWEDLDSPGPVQGATLSEYEGKLYRVGGMRIENSEAQETKLVSLDTFEVFDPDTLRWTSLPSLPLPRSSHNASFIGSELYVVGGWQLEGGVTSGTWHTTMLVADVARTPVAWRSVEVPFKIRALAVEGLGQQLFVIGGIAGHAVKNTVNVYDTRTGDWTSGPPLPEPGFGIRAATWNGRLYASGASGTIYGLSSDQSVWQRTAELNFGRIFHEMVAVDEAELLFVGGMPGHKRARRVKHIERLSREPERPRVQTWTIDSDLASKNRQGIFLTGGALYFFGGNRSLGQHDFAPENFLNNGARLDLASLGFSAVKDFPRRRQSMQTLLVDSGSALVLGGFGHERGTLATQAEVFRYDLDSDEWSGVAPGLPHGRSQFGVAEHGGQIWVFGGLNYDETRKGDQQFLHPRKVVSARPDQLDQGFVETNIVLPRPRRAFAGALLEGRFYLIGGMADGFKLVEECDVYDFKAQAWETLPPPSTPRIGAEAVAMDGKLYLIAGRSAGAAGGALQANTSIEMFDPSTGQWRVLVQQLPMETLHLRAFPFKHQLLLVSTQRDDGQVQIAILSPGFHHHG